MTGILARSALTAVVLTFMFPWVGVPALAADAAIKIANFTFTPRQLTVKAGTRVTWTNADDIPHTVTSSTKLFNSGALDSDQKFSFTFTTSGTYKYFCALHPFMTGTIVVEAAAGSSLPQ